MLYERRGSCSRGQAGGSWGGGGGGRGCKRKGRAVVIVKNEMG